MFEWTRTADAGSEPLSTAEANLECRVDTSTENALVDEAVKASRMDAEQYLGRGLISQTWKLIASEWADVFPLPMAAPLIAISSLKYYDTSGVQQTLDSSYYLVDTVSTPGRLRRAPNKVWPALQSDREDGIEIIYTLGFANAGAVPAAIKSGIRILTRARFEREAGDAWKASVEAAQACWAPWRVFFAPPRCAA